MQNIIAIISFHNADNYGAVLQNYALQKAIDSLGFSSITMNLDDKKIKKIPSIKE